MAAPLFYAVSLIQVLTRDGYDITRHPLSLLSLGDGGWIQITNFIVTGLLFVVCAVGLRRTLHPGRAGTWGPILIGVFGIGLVAGGVFVADASGGFPPGSPADASAVSWHGIIHGTAPIVGFLALTAATFVFTRRFAGLRQRGWAVYSATSGVLAFALSSLASAPGGGVYLAAAGLIGWGWASALAAHLRHQPAGSTEQG